MAVYQVCEFNAKSQDQQLKSFKGRASWFWDFVCYKSKMETTSLNFMEILEGAMNLLCWKVKVTLLLDENDLWDIIKDVVT